MFSTLNLRALTNPEFQQFIRLLTEKANAAGVDALKIKTPYDQLMANLAQLEAALNQEKASEETREIELLDQDRDELYVGFTNLIDGYSRARNAAKKEAAQLIRLLLRSQGRNVVRQNYQAETAILDNVVKSLTTDARYTAALAALTLQDWITDIDTANKAFVSRFSARNTSLSKNENVPAFGELRKQAMPLVDRLYTLIESRYTTAQEDAQPTQAYVDLIREINTLIDGFVPYTLPKGKEDKTPPPTPAP